MPISSTDLSLYVHCMTEAEFWNELYGLLRQAETFSELGAIDWIKPKKYLIGVESTIQGTMGFLEGQLSSREFEFRLRRNFDSLAEIDWESCLPTAEEAGWLWLNSEKIILEAPAVKAIE